MTLVLPCDESLHQTRYETDSLPAGDDAARAHFLLTVVGGLSFERALPGAEDILLAREAVVLGLAVDAVLGTTPA